MVRRQHHGGFGPDEGPGHGPGRSSSAGISEACLGFFRSLAQTAKLITLYKAHHPVPAGSLQTTLGLLQSLFEAASCQEATVAFADGRWLVNGHPVSGAAPAAEVLEGIFRARAIHSITFSGAVRLHELAALCELGSAGASRIEELDVADFLKHRGVRHIRVNAERYSRAVRSQASAPAVASPIPPRTEGAAPSSWAQRLSGLPFGSFIKALVDESVSDPDERAMIYTEALRSVKEALERRVAEATQTIATEKARLENVHVRTESVLSRVAEGKMVVDKDGRVLMMDPVAEEILGKPLKEIAGKPILETVKDQEHVVALSAGLSNPEDQTASGEVQVVADSEVLRAYQKSMALVQDEEGHVVGTYGILPAAAKFREAIRMQQEFVSHVTHELKAPLAAVCSALEIVTEKAGGKLSHEELKFLDISLKNARQLGQMIGEILDFSKLESGRMRVSASPVPAEPMLREAVESLRPWAASKRLSMAIEPLTGEAKTSLVLADHSRLVQILTNLISNAIKSTPEGGCIVVAAAPGQDKNAGRMVFSVRDTGCGIAEKDQERIFDNFTQVVAAGKRREGVGLGLAIVKELVSRHNGSLWLESQPGRGSVFSFSIPIASYAPSSGS